MFVYHAEGENGAQEHEGETQLREELGEEARMEIQNSLDVSIGIPTENSTTIFCRTKTLAFLFSLREQNKK